MNSPSDAKIVEHDENEPGSDIDNLELARRNENEIDNTILTITMNDEQSLEIISDFSQHHPKCCSCGRVFMPVLVLVLSLCFLVTAIILVEANAKHNGRTSFHSFFIILRSLGAFAFIGQLSFLVACKTAFLNFRLLTCERSMHREKQEVAGVIKRFLSCDIFEETAVRNYFQRINRIMDQNQRQEIFNFIESAEIDDVVSDHLACLYNSPEGSFLEMIGVNKLEFHSYSRNLLRQTICKILPSVLKEAAKVYSHRPEAFRAHMDEIVNQRLHYLDLRIINKFLRDTSRRRNNKMSVVIFICSVLAGCIFEATRLFTLEN